MKAIIIEDEHLAAQALQALVQEVAPEIEILAILQSIDESVEWFQTHKMPDLVFMDIHLADGSSFSIFDDVNITCPIIFTTAYDEYALKAFEVNSVDYLLKPINKPDLERAVGKFKRLAGAGDEVTDHSGLIDKLMTVIHRRPMIYKSSLLVPFKDKLIPLQVKEIAYIYIDTKVVKAISFEGKSYTLDATMDELSRQLDPESFYRANRQYIIARSAIKDMAVWFGNKLAVNLSVSTPERIFISRTNVKEFKSWITG